MKQAASFRRIRWVFYKEYSSFPGSGYPSLSLGLVVFLAGLISVILVRQGATYEQVTGDLLYGFYILTLLAGVFLTMNSFIQEKKQGTLDLLYTLPVTDFELVTGKVLMNLTALAALLFLLEVVYVILIAETPLFQAVSSYLGFVLLAYYAVTLGIFASTLTESPLVSLIVSASVLIAVDVGGFMAGLFPSPAREILSYFHALNQFLPFTRGILPLKGSVFFLSAGALFHLLAVKSLEFRRFRGWN